jgi:hypothetical protein
MNKKIYQKPTVEKVKLEVKNAVLASCRLSPDPVSQEGNGSCVLPEPAGQCFNPF